MTPLDVREFAAFFSAVNPTADGKPRQPFRWQRRLAERVFARRDGSPWPRLIHVPTGAGKTAVLEIAVFAVALDAARPARERRSPRRVAFVVDRRVVVSQAAERARQIAKVLDEATQDTIAWRVAERLRSLSGNRGADGAENPRALDIVEWRGGIPHERGSELHPLHATVIVSTVDQVGSRLLFRGYGASDGMRPIHAGLLSQDTLIFLDEAHLSTAFEETLSGLTDFRTRRWAPDAVERPWQVVRMTATPREIDPDLDFALNDADRADENLAPRLRARKAALLQLVPGSTSDPSRAALDHEMVDAAKRVLAGDPSVRVLGVVVNRVASARAVFEELRRLGAELQVECVLLTGRARPYDRTRLVDEWWDKIRAGRGDRSGSGPRTIVVATQAIEVGADLDFDALVTEACSLDALVQRLGRVDRLGLRRGSSPVRVLVRKADVSSTADDPVYGTALAATWRWLDKNADRKNGIDLGIDGLSARLPTGPGRTEMLPPGQTVPVLLPSHLDAWVQTLPRPVPDPSPELFLHGQRKSPADVLVVWRADLPELQSTCWRDRVATCPPVTAEALSLPISAVRAWLQGVGAASIADVEGQHQGADDEEAPSTDRPVLRWRGPDDDDTRLIVASQVRPGDTIVVPTAYGGLDRFGWIPGSGASVVDVGDLVATEGLRRPRLRLHADLVLGWMRADHPSSERTVWLSEMRSAMEGARDDVGAWDGDAIRAVLTRLADPDQPIDPDTHALARALTALAPGHLRLRAYDDDSGVVVESVATADDVTQPDADDASSVTGRATPLDAHLAGVGALAEQFAVGCGLGPDLASDLALAGQIHDLGKADSRFQIMLHGGNELKAATTSALLAKSGMDPRDRRSFRIAHELSGLPRGWRHEAMSAALVQHAESLRKRARDWDLVLHLVASHHGYARPFLPPVADDVQGDVKVASYGAALSATRTDAASLARIDSGVADRFWRLVRRYGWFGLAYLETILRLADSIRSRHESRQPVTARDPEAVT